MSRFPKQLHIRVREEDPARFKAAARLAGVSVSEWVRRACSRFLVPLEPGEPGFEIPPAPDVPADDEYRPVGVCDLEARMVGGAAHLNVIAYLEAARARAENDLVRAAGAPLPALHQAKRVEVPQEYQDAVREAESRLLWWADNATPEGAPAIRLKIWPAPGWVTRSVNEALHPTAHAKGGKAAAGGLIRIYPGPKKRKGTK